MFSSLALTGSLLVLSFMHTSYLVLFHSLASHTYYLATGISHTSLLSCIHTGIQSLFLYHYRLSFYTYQGNCYIQLFLLQLPFNCPLVSDQFPILYSSPDLYPRMLSWQKCDVSVPCDWSMQRRCTAFQLGEFHHVESRHWFLPWLLFVESVKLLKS